MNKFTLLQKIGIYVGTLVFLVFLLAPFLVMFVTSLRPLDHLMTSPFRFLDNDLSFKAYSEMWVKVPLLGRYIFNSFFIAFVVMILSLIIVVPAAYAYARFEFPGKGISLSIFLSINMLIGAVLIIPLYKVMLTLKLLNTYWSMIIPGVAFTIPTGIWLLKAYIAKIPKELEEAAYVDGASRLYTLRRVILPLAVPGMIVVGITNFIAAYAQQFLFAITFNQKRELQPLPAGLYDFVGHQTVVWNQLMAAALIGILPVLVLFLFLQKYLVAGLTAGAIKE